VRTACCYEVDLVVRPGDDFAPIAVFGSILRLLPLALTGVPVKQGLRLP
jgi:hypothetical protein